MKFLRDFSPHPFRIGIDRFSISKLFLLLCLCCAIVTSSSSSSSDSSDKVEEGEARSISSSNVISTNFAALKNNTFRTASKKFGKWATLTSTPSSTTSQGSSVPSSAPTSPPTSSRPTSRTTSKPSTTKRSFSSSTTSATTTSTKGTTGVSSPSPQPLPQPEYLRADEFEFKKVKNTSLSSYDFARRINEQESEDDLEVPDQIMSGSDTFVNVAPPPSSTPATASTPSKAERRMDGDDNGENGFMTQGNARLNFPDNFQKFGVQDSLIYKERSTSTPVTVITGRSGGPTVGFTNRRDFPTGLGVTPNPPVNHFPTTFQQAGGFNPAAAAGHHYQFQSAPPQPTSGGAYANFFGAGGGLYEINPFAGGQQQHHPSNPNIQSFSPYYNHPQNTRPTHAPTQNQRVQGSRSLNFNNQYNNNLNHPNNFFPSSAPSTSTNGRFQSHVPISFASSHMDSWAPSSYPLNTNTGPVYRGPTKRTGRIGKDQNLLNHLNENEIASSPSRTPEIQGFMPLTPMKTFTAVVTPHSTIESDESPENKGNSPAGDEGFLGSFEAGDMPEVVNAPVPSSSSPPPEESTVVPVLRPMGFATSSHDSSSGLNEISELSQEQNNGSPEHSPSESQSGSGYNDFGQNEIENVPSRGDHRHESHQIHSPPSGEQHDEAQDAPDMPDMENLKLQPPPLNEHNILPVPENQPHFQSSSQVEEYPGSTTPSSQHANPNSNENDNNSQGFQSGEEESPKSFGDFQGFSGGNVPSPQNSHGAQGFSGFGKFPQEQLHNPQGPPTSAPLHGFTSTSHFSQGNDLVGFHFTPTSSHYNKNVQQQQHHHQGQQINHFPGFGINPFQGGEAHNAQAQPQGFSTGFIGGGPNFNSPFLSQPDALQGYNGFPDPNGQSQFTPLQPPKGFPGFGPVQSQNSNGVSSDGPGMFENDGHHSSHIEMDPSQNDANSLEAPPTSTFHAEQGFEHLPSPQAFFSSAISQERSGLPSDGQSVEGASVEAQGPKRVRGKKRGKGPNFSTSSTVQHPPGDSGTSQQSIHSFGGFSVEQTNPTNPPTAKPSSTNPNGFQDFGRFPGRNAQLVLKPDNAPRQARLRSPKVLNQAGNGFQENDVASSAEIGMQHNPGFIGQGLNGPIHGNVGPQLHNSQGSSMSTVSQTQGFGLQHDLGLSGSLFGATAPASQNVLPDPGFLGSQGIRNAPIGGDNGPGIVPSPLGQGFAPNQVDLNFHGLAQASLNAAGFGGGNQGQGVAFSAGVPGPEFNPAGQGSGFIAGGPGQLGGIGGGPNNGPIANNPGQGQGFGGAGPGPGFNVVGPGFFNSPNGPAGPVGNNPVGAAPLGPGGPGPVGSPGGAPGGGDGGHGPHDGHPLGHPNPPPNGPIFHPKQPGHGFFGGKGPLRGLGLLRSILGKLGKFGHVKGGVHKPVGKPGLSVNAGVQVSAGVNVNNGGVGNLKHGLKDKDKLALKHKLKLPVAKVLKIVVTLIQKWLDFYAKFSIPKDHYLRVISFAGVYLLFAWLFKDSEHLLHPKCEAWGWGGPEEFSYHAPARFVPAIPVDQHMQQEFLDLFRGIEDCHDGKCDKKKGKKKRKNKKKDKDHHRGQDKKNNRRSSEEDEDEEEDDEEDDETSAEMMDGYQMELKYINDMCPRNQFFYSMSPYHIEAWTTLQRMFVAQKSPADVLHLARAILHSRSVNPKVWYLGLLAAAAERPDMTGFALAHPIDAMPDLFVPGHLIDDEFKRYRGLMREKRSLVPRQFNGTTILVHSNHRADRYIISARNSTKTTTTTTTTTARPSTISSTPVPVKGGIPPVKLVMSMGSKKNESSPKFGKSIEVEQKDENESEEDSDEEEDDEVDDDDDDDDSNERGGNHKKKHPLGYGFGQIGDGFGGYKRHQGQGQGGNGLGFLGGNKGDGGDGDGDDRKHKHKKGKGKKKKGKGKKGKKCIIVDGSVGLDNGPENKLWYWREDMMLNQHHAYWHQAYAINATRHPDRRAELFFYMHRSFLARYNSERLSNGFGRTVELGLYPGAIIEEGYDSHIKDFNSGQWWAPRAPHTPLQDIYHIHDPDYARDIIITDVIGLYNKFVKAIKTGKLLTADGKFLPIRFHEGLQPLANTVEASNLSVNPFYYDAFGLHNLGHLLVGLAADPDWSKKLPSGIMSEAAVSMRDPAFYTYHTILDNLFEKFKQTLPPYKPYGGVWPLQWHGVDIVDVKVLSHADANLLSTFYIKHKYKLEPGVDRSVEKGIEKAEICAVHLDHAPFKFQITIDKKKCAKSKTGKGTVRIFMAPRYNEEGERLSYAEQRRLMFQLDAFQVDLHVGRNIITRSSKDNQLTKPWSKSITEYERGPDPSGAADFCGCGWPHHLFIPKGNTKGMPFDLFTMVTNFDEDLVTDLPQDLEIPEPCNSPYIFCGHPRRRYPDARPMGYPFDRPGYHVPAKACGHGLTIKDLLCKIAGKIFTRPVATLEEYVSGASNMAMTVVEIKHIPKVIGKHHG